MSLLSRLESLEERAGGRGKRPEVAILIGINKDPAAFAKELREASKRLDRARDEGRPTVRVQIG